MNLKRLQTFVHVADCLCFSEVAEMMNVTQSGISRQIKALEEEIGILLLNRKSSNVELTLAGRLVYKKATSLLNQWEELLQECQGLKHEMSGILKIGASTIPGTYLLPRIIKDYQSKYPKVEFSVRIEGSTEILASLDNKQIDIAIVGRKPEQAHFQTQCIAQDRLVLIAKEASPHKVTLEEIEKRPFIVREKGSGTREAIDHSLRQNGIEPDELHYAAEVSSTESILAMVEAGIGIAFVSNWAVQELMRDRINILCELPTERCFYMASHQSRSSHPVIQSFMQEAAEVYSCSLTEC
jgi:DNA-binding transcriptional LysR family regulator